LDGMFVDEKDLTSPSHAITVRRTGDQLRVSLADKGDVPDRDFVLRWTEQNAEALASRAWVCQKDQDTYALLEIRAPKDASSERAPVDFYFLVDRSGSMANEKWNKATQALQSCMKVLGPADRAMVTVFENSFQDFAERPLSAQELLQDPQFQTIVRLGARGGTQLRPALQHVLEVAAKHSASNYKNLILITDAQVGNETAILELLKSTHNFPVHCFGIDVALNDSLLMALCRQQGGTFHSLNPRDDIEQAVTSLGKTLGQPVLLDLRLPEGWEPAEAVIPNLYAGQIHYLSARSSNGQPLEITARGAALQPLKIQFEKQPATFDAPWLHWCRSRIQRLVTEGNETAAVALSVASNLICPLTAFVAWDDSQKVPIASHELVQPGLELDGMRGEMAKPCGLARASRSGADFRLKARRAGTAHFFGRAARFFAAHAENTAPDELDWRGQLSDICIKTGVRGWEILLRTLIHWISEATGPEQSQRLERLERLVEEIKPHAERLEQSRASQKPKDAEEALVQIHKILKEFLETLPLKDSVKVQLIHGTTSGS